MADTATTSYRDVMPNTLRYLARGCAVRLAYVGSSFSGSITRALATPRVQFLYLHHLFSDEVEDFRKLLRTVTATHEVVSYGAAVDLLREGNPQKPYISFSFDDGFKNNLTGARVLDEFGIKACFFVATDYIGLTDPARKAEVCRGVFNMPPMDFMNWKDLETLVENGHEIGNHSSDHVRLSDLSIEKAKENILVSQETLRRRLGEIVHFAWPYGWRLDLPDEIADFVRENGFRSVASAERGCHVRQLDSDELIYRDRVVAAEPIHEILYFMARNSRRASAKLMV